MTTEAIFVGATIVGAPDAAQYFGPIKVPGNMSKAATIATHRAKVEDARTMHMLLAPTTLSDVHSHRPMIGMLASVAVVGQDGKELYSQVAETPERGKVALPFINFLKEAYPGQFPDALRHADAIPRTIVFGFNIKQILRIAAFEILGNNVTAEAIETAYVPVRLWSSPVGVIDPLDILLSKDDQRDLDLYSVFRYLGILVDRDALLGNALSQAHYVKNLADKAQLVPLSTGS
jgi:hypothetical protein